MSYTSKKLIVLWLIAILMTIAKIAGLYSFSWYWIIGCVILSFTTFTVNGKKI